MNPLAWFDFTYLFPRVIVVPDVFFVPREPRRVSLDPKPDTLFARIGIDLHEKPLVILAVEKRCPGRDYPRYPRLDLVVSEDLVCV